MQNYNEMVGSQVIKDYWHYIVSNDKTIRSNYSGANPPTGVEVGTTWFCTKDSGSIDSQVLYVLSGSNGNTTPTAQQQVWKPVADLKLNVFEVVRERASLTGTVNFNNFKQNGIYKVAPNTTDWGNSGTARPNYKSIVTNTNTGAQTITNTVYSGESGILACFGFSGNSGVRAASNSNNFPTMQLYGDLNNDSLFFRTYTGSSWKAWGRVWTDKNLYQTSQLYNNGDGTSGSKFLVMRDITSSVINDKLGYTPVNPNKICAGGNTVPAWNNIAPVINTSGIMHIGRYIKFHPSTGASAVTITLDAGTNTGASRVLSVYGNTSTDAASILASNDVIGFSDERLKTDIQTIEHALSKVMQVRGVTFKRIDIDKKAPRQTGVVAQEVQKVLPEAVRSVAKPDSDIEYLTVAYGNMVGLLIEAIKEQQQMIEAIASATGVDLSEFKQPKPEPKKTTKRTTRKKTTKKAVYWQIP